MNKKSILYILAAGGLIQLNIIFANSLGYDNISLAKLTSPLENNTIAQAQEVKKSKTHQNKTTPSQENNMSIIRDITKECVVIGPFFGKSNSQIKNLIVGYEPNFKNKLKTHEIKKPVWNIIVSSEDTNSPSKTMEKFQELGIDLDNVIFQENGNIFVNSFDNRTDALDFSYSLHEKGQNNYLVKDNMSEYFYYIINPSNQYYARLQAFDTYFENTSIREIDCDKDNNNQNE